MSDIQDDALRIALVSHKARADEEDSRQSWKTFFWSVCFYACFQFFYVMAKLAGPAITLENLPWEKLFLWNWSGGGYVNCSWFSCFYCHNQCGSLRRQARAAFG
ncbi:hypothetical protein ACQR35_14545 [Pseudarthrobacter sp. J1738]|uniref:hypothetical protein n=1 Tax=Pseudarthrobacter sp. J1738 TaxID=3420446 RepID=UPI003D2D6765